MQAASTANAEDGKGKGAGAGSGAGAKPTRKMSAYFLFQQASRGDMYVKFGGKDAFTSNLHERHKPCQQSTEVCTSCRKPPPEIPSLLVYHMRS